MTTTKTKPKAEKAATAKKPSTGKVSGEPDKKLGEKLGKRLAAREEAKSAPKKSEPKSKKASPEAILGHVESVLDPKGKKDAKKATPNAKKKESIEVTVGKVTKAKEKAVKTGEPVVTAVQKPEDEGMLATANKIPVACPFCAKQTRRAGEREYAHVGMKVVRYYCEKDGGCKRYHMRNKSTGEVVTAPEGWSRSDSIRKGLGAKSARYAELEAKLEALQAENETLKAIGGGSVAPVEDRVVSVLGIDVSGLEYQKRPDNGKPRLTFNAMGDDEIAKLDPESAAHVRDMQSRVLKINASIGHYKSVASGKAQAPSL